MEDGGYDVMKTIVSLKWMDDLKVKVLKDRTYFVFR